jgi:hypothetical protein
MSELSLALPPGREAQRSYAGAWQTASSASSPAPSPVPPDRGRRDDRPRVQCGMPGGTGVQLGDFTDDDLSPKDHGRNVQNPRSLMCDSSIRICSRLYCRMLPRAARVLLRSCPEMWAPPKEPWCEVAC